LLGIVCAIGFSAPIVGAQSICGEWMPVEVPAGFQTLTDVTASSPSAAWALAGYANAVHWDGSAWSEFALPDLSDLGTAFDLRATASLAPSHFFVAGILQTSVWTTEQLLLIWDGSDWDRIESVELEPNIAGAPRYGSPSAIAAATPDDLWIIGLASGSGDGVSGAPILTVHWDGSQLTEVHTPGVGNRQNNMEDAVAIASDDMWAVGSYNNTGVGDYAFHGMTYHYDGSSWNHVPSPTQSIDSSHLNAVAAIATDDVWAAGDSPAGPLFMHWDGGSWTIVPGPPGVTGTVHGLAAIATDDVWAVDFPWQVPVIGKYYHWDGTAWSVVLPEVAGATQIARHGGLAAVGECDVWAVGNINFGSGAEAFIERLQAGAGMTAAPSVTAGVSSLEVLPNPMRHSARIRFAMPGDVPSHAHIYNVRGRRVRALFEEPVSGSTVTWDGRDDAGERVPAGVYLLRVESNDGEALTKKLTVVR
jgi:hypothetical protein